MKLIDLHSEPVKTYLPILLKDRTSGRNIIFATDVYGLDEKSEITEEVLASLGEDAVCPRVLKSQETQSARTRSKAEVFTPAWIVNKMNNQCDKEWFGLEGVFNTEEGHSWKVNPEKVSFGNPGGWKEYVESKRIEITCGEAPYLASRYDASTGKPIEIQKRVGILDRKLRVVGENAQTEEEWLLWAKAAFQNVYGYEFQGDSLLIARVNLFLTFIAYYQARYIHKPSDDIMTEIADVISWNVWQMDGITGTIPFMKPKKRELSLFDFETDGENQENFDAECKVKDWKSGTTTTYIKIREGRK